MSLRAIRKAVLLMSLCAIPAVPPALASDVQQPWVERDLQQALASEAQSYLKYQAYAAQARKEGMPRIAELFHTVAHSELTKHFAAHGKLVGLDGTPEQMLHKVTHGIGFTGPVGSTRDNLREAVRDEHDSLVSLYGELARRAVGSGHPTIVNHYLALAADERQHRDAFEAAIQQIGPAPTAGTARVRP